MKKIKNTAFTLVELIVVITILAVLATVAFISFQGYASSSRDSVRLADMSNISKGFHLKITQGENIPLPDNNIQITASGTILSYQGNASKQVLQSIGIHGDGVDPVDGTYYTYSTNASRNKYQILGFLERDETISFSSSAFANLNDRFIRVKGDELGMFLESDTKESVHNQSNNIDIINTDTQYIGVFNNSENEVTGTGSFFEKKLDFRINTYGSCEGILKNGLSKGNGIYTISPTGSDTDISVYCDMKNGGYTALFSVNPSGTTWRYDSSQWANPTTNINDFLTQETTFDSYGDFSTQSIRICRGDLDSCYTMNHNKNISLQKFYTDDITYIDFSVWNKREDLADDDPYNTNTPDNIGVDNTQLFLTSLNIPYSFNYDYNKYGLGINITGNNKLGFQGDSNNIWPTFDNAGYGIGQFVNWPGGSTPCTTSPVPPSQALSTLMTGGPCYYENPDNQMWYVLGK